MRETTPTIAVLASGSGSTFEAFVHASQEGIVDAEVGLVVCNDPEAGIFERVDRLNKQYGLDIQSEVVNQHLYPAGEQERGQTLEESAKICELVHEGRFSLVALMGYMRVIAAEGDLMRQYGWLPDYEDMYPNNRGIYLARMINTHPGILPATADTYGIHTQERVIELGLAETAQTLHVVAAGVDTGPTIAENRVPVYSDDTPEKLFDRVQRIEKAHLPIDINTFLKEQQARRAA